MNPFYFINALIFNENYFLMHPFYTPLIFASPLFMLYICTRQFL